MLPPVFIEAPSVVVRGSGFDVRCWFTVHRRFEVQRLRGFEVEVSPGTMNAEPTLNRELTLNPEPRTLNYSRYC
jgi:hypothetical protein